MSQRPALLAFTLLLLQRHLPAGDILQLGRPAEVGMSAGKLRKAVRIFETAVEKDRIRGAVLLLARRGRIVLHEALGWRNREKRQPMRPDTLFRVASNTKPVVAAGVFILADAGRLSIDDRLGEHLPAFNNEKCREVRIRHLLNHTSGLRIKTLFLYPLMKPSAEHPDAPNLRLEVNRFAAVGPAKTPGRTYRYSNAGYNTLGALIETVSGVPLEEFLAGNIYRPLGMRETTHGPPEEKIDRMSVVYVWDEKAGEWSIRFKQGTRMRSPFVRASGGLISTAEEYARFCQMFLNGGTYGGRRILSQQAVRQMTHPQTRALRSNEDGRELDRHYGYGWFVDSCGVFSHGGSDGTWAWVDPRRQLVGLVFTQSPKAKIPRDEFVRLVNAACEE